ncbi:MAG TPA: DUF4271 domain-containing protein [Mucilaginibacter sp.]|jgi:hypothetical protein
MSFCCGAAYAQHDSLTGKESDSLSPGNTQPIDIAMIDSATLAKRSQFVADSITRFYFFPDSMRENQLLSKLWTNKIPGIYFNSALESENTGQSGQVRKLRDLWLILAICGLLIYAAMLNLLLGKDIKIVIQSFYYKQALSQPNKEGGPINFWAFIGLFLLFSLTFGLVLCQLSGYYNLYYGVSDFQLFILLSFVIGLLFALKFLVLKFIGFVFDMNRMVSEYITILNLTYFNIAFVLLCVSICFSLLAEHYIPYLLISTLALIAIIFAWQYLRNSVSIVSNFRFHKFYLFIYLCALEICPILILIKALNINF